MSNSFILTNLLRNAKRTQFDDLNVKDKDEISKEQFQKDKIANYLSSFLSVDMINDLNLKNIKGGDGEDMKNLFKSKPNSSRTEAVSINQANDANLFKRKSSQDEFKKENDDGGLSSNFKKEV